jgi:hypothetical protein
MGGDGQARSGAGHAGGAGRLGQGAERGRPGPGDPGRVFDCTTTLDGLLEAYNAMNERRAVKSLLQISTAA